MKKLWFSIIILSIIGFGIWAYLETQAYPEDAKWIMFVISGLCLAFNLTILLIYRFRKILLSPFKSFWQLTFERKMMLLVVIAILIGVGFYAWSVWEKQKYFERQEETILEKFWER